MIKVTYQISQKDYLRLTFLVMYRSWAYRLISGLGVFVIPFLMLAYQNYEAWGRDVVFPLWIVTFLALYLPFTFYLRSRRFYQKTKDFHHPIEFRFSEKNMRTKTASATHDYLLSKLFKVIETKEWLIFYYNSRVYNFVPKKAFDSSEDLETVKSFICATPHLKQQLLP